MSEDWTVAQLRDALFDLDVKFTHKDKKADLLALYKKNSKLELGEEPKSPVTNKKSKIIGKGQLRC